MREIVKRTIVPDEIPVCWPAAFRGAMHRLNTEFWTLNLERLRS